MPVKDILVHVDDSARGKMRVSLGADLATRHGARLIGFGINPAIAVPAFVGAEIPVQIWEEQARQMDARLAAAAKLFAGQVERAGVPSEWRVLGDQVGDPAALVSISARYADLAIVGQPSPEGNVGSLSMDTVERVVLDAGGPVVVVPYAGTFTAMGKRAMLAWNGSREAARAARDAMAVLEKGASITVMEVNPKGKSRAERDVVGADIAAHLARHGYKCEVAHVIAEDMKVGDMILSRASDAGADLIIMGAYGHSRLREMVLGGATAYVLQHMTMPVLMSH
jgi:nucleotide-binding universal stress UspA family protein